MIASAVLLAAGVASAVEIHPSGPSIPENLLRIELRFARPQRLPFLIERLHLVDARGSSIEGALLDLALPSADGRRLSVMMDPGRVKTGAGPNRDAGRALRAGETVHLVLDDPAAGRPVTVKTWTVTEAVTHPLRVDAWRLEAPRAGSREALVADLREPISSVGEHLIAVVDAAGQRVAGHAVLSRGDSIWTFRPDRPWRETGYRVLRHPELEDPAGNRRCAAFEQMRASKVRCDPDPGLPFRPRVAPR